MSSFTLSPSRPDRLPQKKPARGEGPVTNDRPNGRVPLISPSFSAVLFHSSIDFRERGGRFREVGSSPAPRLGRTEQKDSLKFYSGQVACAG